MIYLVFIAGSIFGSFLNVVIYRLNPALQLKSGVFGRSFCPNCKHQLRWHDLVPILSFIWLRGRCRYCQKKISWQYPIVEVLSGFIWIGVFYKVFGINFSAIGGSAFGGQFSLPAAALAQAGIFNFQSIFNFQYLDIFYEIFIFSAFLVIAVYDFKWQIIPNKIVYPAITTALIFHLFNTFKSGNFEIFIYSLFTAVIAFLFFFSIFYFSKGRAMGFGDAKLAFLTGLFLGPLYSAVAFTLAFIIGALFAILLIVFKKKSWKSQIAFGPFLVIGVFMAFFLSDFIIKLFQP